MEKGVKRPAASTHYTHMQWLAVSQSVRKGETEPNRAVAGGADNKGSLLSYPLLDESVLYTAAD